MAWLGESWGRREGSGKVESGKKAMLGSRTLEGSVPCKKVPALLLTTPTNHDSGLSLPVSVNELQKKLEEEVDRRREKWEEEQGRHITREEALVTSTKQKLNQEEGECELSHFGCGH